MVANIFTILIFTLVACGDNEIIPPKESMEEDKVVEIEWASRIELDQSVVGCDINQIYKQTLIHFGDLDFPAIIYGHSSTSGERIWKYEYEGWDNTNIDYSYLYENILICVTGKRVFGFDLDKVEQEWEYNLKDRNWLRSTGSVTLNNKFHLVVSENFDPLGGFNQILLEFDIFTGAVVEAIKYIPDSIGTKTISPPVSDDKGILYFNLYENAEAPPQDSRQDLVAYDIKSESELWRTRVIDFFASNSLHPPTIYDNRIVITGGARFMFGFDILTGNQLWKTEINPDNPFSIFNKTNHLIYEDRLYVNEGGFYVTCLNPESGDIIWNNEKGGPNSTDNMLYYEKEDLLVFTSWGYGSVMVLDAITGRTLHRERGYDNDTYNNDVVYDEENDIFCTTSYKHAVGFKVKRITD